MNDHDDASIPDDWVMCKCPICNGARVPLGTRRQHRRIFCDAVADEEHSARTSSTNTISADIKSISTIVGTTETGVGSSIASQGADDLSSSMLDKEVFTMTFITEALGEVEDEAVPLTQSDQAVFERLWQIDDAFRLHAKAVAEHVSAMDKAVQECDEASICVLKPSLTGDSFGLQVRLDELHAIDTLGDKAHEAWKKQLRKSMENLLGELGASGYAVVSEAFKITDPLTKFVVTDEYLGTHLHAMNPLILIPILLVISLNLFAHLSREWCNSTLRVLRLYAKIAVCDAGDWSVSSSQPRGTRARLGHGHDQSSNLSAVSPPSQDDTTLPANSPPDLEFFLQNFPLDLRTLKDRFRMQAKIEVYAVCPDSKCCAVYSPVLENGIKTYPRICSKKHLRNRVEKECGELLCVDGVVSGKSVRVPIKSFPVQDWDDFKARLVVNPLVLTLLRRGMACALKSEMRDIKDGTHLANLTDKDGKPFLNADCHELRLAWSFSTDWFNPFHNVTAGKTASVGSIAMTCLNLPPTFRYMPEYVFLAGVIPGPDEPKDDLVNNFLDVIVDQLERSYNHGTHYSTTYIFPGGVVERSIVAVFVFDLPGARKCCGMQSHSSKRNFCHLCRLRLSDINNLDMAQWNFRNLETHRADALKWKAETVKTKKEQMFSQTGVRWTPFLRLPYFHPHRSVIIDGMHNLFLGLAMYHVRDFLGIDTKAEEEKRKSDAKVNINQLAKARSKLKEDPSIKTIKSFSFPILRALCDENDVLTDDADGPEAKAKNLQRALLSRMQSNGNKDEVHKFQFTTGLVGVDYFDGCDPDPVRVIGPISDDELKTIRSYIASTVRPRWHKGPPRNLGEARHGKLKADQWRTLMEFDIPVALAQLWEIPSERRQLFHCTMLLAIAMRYATSHVITKVHVDQYKKYMVEYLKALREIDPLSNLHPNHHEALHIPDFLEYFGPMHGWWMFVYERMIGLLQNMNTNYKIGGQMERTMMESFCAAANFRALLKRLDLPGTVQNIADAIELPEEIRGTLRQSIHTNFSKTPLVKTSKKERENEKLSELDDDVIEALGKVSAGISTFIGRSWSPPRRAVKTDRVVIDGKTFSVEKTTNSMGLICVRNGDSYVPGKLRDIISITYPDAADSHSLNVLFIFVVHLHLPASSKIPNPFVDYPDFGANLWSSSCYHRPSVVMATPSARFCHGIFRDWDERHVVVKALDREFNLPSSYVG